MKLWMAPAGLHVEPAQSRHVLAMAKLHASSFFHGWTQSDFTAYLATPHTHPVYVACDAKHRVAGFMVLALTGDECELLSINVEPKWRGKGVGRAILQAGIDDLAISGIAAMHLEVDEANKGAIALYHHFGFTQVGKREGYYPSKEGPGATALVMCANFN